MARRPEGWKLKEKDTGIFHVRFSYEGGRYEITTGTRDPDEAPQIAARIYSDVIDGKLNKTETGELAHPKMDLDILTAKWLANIMPELRGKTPKTYMTYARTWKRTFDTLDGITSSGIGDYQRKRLTQVIKRTVVKERCGLHRFLKWLKEKKYLREVPAFPDIPKRALGTVYEKAKRRSIPQLALTPEWTTVFLNGLPHSSERKGFLVRPRFRFQFGTALRPSFIDQVTWDDVQPDNRLRIKGWLDKNGNARRVPLTRVALEALEEAGPPVPGQLIFGRHDYRDYVDEAKKLLPAHLREEFTPYGLKHARVTQLVRAGESTLGIERLTGTKYALDRYALASDEDAEDIASRY